MTGKELSKWSDRFMFTAEESLAADGPSAYLLGGPIDPLGQIAACAKMYKGQVVRDLSEVTDDERRSYLKEIQKTVLKMPLEAVQLHFMIEGVTRSFTHQMVRQRTASYAQESMRFAVKEDAATAVAMPPSLEGTLSFREYLEQDMVKRIAAGFMVKEDDAAWLNDYTKGVRQEIMDKGGKQAWRLRWDEQVATNSAEYLALVNDGMPAEDARGLTLHNITTRLNYITNLRSWYDTMAVRVSDQAQFEWRKVAMMMAKAMMAYGETQSYWTTISESEYNSWDQNTPSNPILEREFIGDARVKIRLSSAWQYKALAYELKPIEFKIGGPAFGADFDRPSRIGERVIEFHKHGVPSDQWTTGSEEHGIPPIHPSEWLLDPDSARLPDGMEFDAFGNRVPIGTGWHFVAPGILGKAAYGDMPLTGARWPRDFDADGNYTTEFKPGAEEQDQGDGTVDLEDLSSDDLPGMWDRSDFL